MIMWLLPLMPRSGGASISARPPATFTAFGLAAEAEAIDPGLHVVATPIGNLKDVSFRALATLAAADAVLAEDTRVTRTLLMHYGITTPLVAYHEHSNAAVRERMIARMQAGEALALVSDAGTPLVSDPGFKLVQAAIEAGLSVTPIPGPSAVMTELIVERTSWRVQLVPASPSRVCTAVPATPVNESWLCGLSPSRQ